MRYQKLHILSGLWRYAENKFIESDFTDDSWKAKVWKKEEALNLTKEEKEYLNDLCQSMGI